MKKFFALLLCVCLTLVPLFADTWSLGTSSDGSVDFSVDIDPTIIHMLEDLGITQDTIQQQLADNGIDLNDYKDEWGSIQKQVQEALNKYSKDFNKQFNDNEDMTKVKNIVPTVKYGFYDFADALVYAIQDSSTLQNTESAAWIGYIFPGFHFRLGIDTSIATLDIDPLLEMTSALGYKLDLSSATDTISDMPIIGSYDHHLVFPTVALNARVGGFILPFDIGLSLLSIDTRGNLEAVWPSDISDEFNINYLTFGLDFRYKLFKLGPSIMNVQIAGLGGMYYTKGGVEATVDQGVATFDFNQLSGSLGVQATGHILFVDAFVGTKLVTNISSSVSLKAKPNWRTILKDSINTGNEESDAKAMDLAVAMMPSEIGFDDAGGWADSFELNPVFYGGIGLSAKIMRLGLAASYNVTSKNLGATVNVRFSW